MKKIITMLFLASLFLQAKAQTENIESFYNRYAKNEKATNVTIKGWLLDVATQFTEDVESRKVLSKITQLRVLLMEEGNPVSNAEYLQLKKDIRNDDFEELLQIRDEGSQVDFFIREEDNHITNVLMLVNETDGFVLLSLEGLLKLEDLKNLKIETEGGAHFEKIKWKEVPRA
jgi:thioredoxin-related protein